METFSALLAIYYRMYAEYQGTVVLFNCIKIHPNQHSQHGFGLAGECAKHSEARFENTCYQTCFLHNILIAIGGLDTSPGVWGTT